MPEKSRSISRKSPHCSISSTEINGLRHDYADPIYSLAGLYAQTLLLQLQGKTSDSEALVQGLLDHPLLPDQTSHRQLLVRYLSKS